MTTGTAIRGWLAGGLAAVLGAGCGPGSDDLLLVGTLERTLIELVAPASEVIVRVRFERGQRVEPEQVVVTLDGTLADAEVARAEATLAGARKGTAVAEREVERLRSLHGSNIASEQALERVELERAEAHARRREAEALLAAAIKRRQDLELKAPAAGTLDQIPFEPGERVPAGAVVAVILEDGDPWVRVWIPEDRFARVGPGTRAEIRIDGLAGTLGGHVLDVAREPEFTPHYALTERDRVHLVYEARVRIEDAPAGIRPGLPAEVRIRADGPAAP